LHSLSKSNVLKGAHDLFWTLDGTVEQVPGTGTG
jgi:hypothetical protein